MIPWDDVTLDDGTGIVHIAPGCGSEDFELSRVHDLPVLTPVDEAGRFYDEYGWLHGLSTVEAAEQIIGWLEERGRLVEAGLHEHRYPECWRCHTPLIFRISDDWFIGVEELRQPLRDANAEVEWTPAYMGKRMDDWLVNMGDWNISRRRYYGLPLPFYPCSCGHLNVIGSKAELEERALRGLDQLEELRRPWIDEVPIACEQCGEEVRRIPEVGDVWLDAGIVPFSTLGWENQEYIPEGYATGAAKGLTTADLPDHAYWEEWFPADWVSEMREQIRLWFYSQHFMSVVLTGTAPFQRVLGYEKMLDETGREMHSSWGNTIDAAGRVRAHGRRRDALAVLRAAAGPEPPLRLRARARDPAQAADALELDPLPRRLRDDRRASGPSGALGPPAERPLDRWLAARTAKLVADATRGLRGVPDRRRDPAPSTSSSTTSRTGTSAARGAASGTATRTRCTRSGRRSSRGSRVVAPVMPFLAEHLWQNLVRGAGGDPPASVHPRRLARGRRGGRGAARRGRRGAPSRRARPSGPAASQSEAPPAAAAARRRGRSARRLARGRAARGAAREGDRVRAASRRPSCT